MGLQQPNDDDHDTNQDDALPARIRSGVEALLGERPAVVAFLRQREEEHVAGEYQQLYDALREWTQNRPALYDCLALLMIGSGRFADDVQADFGQEALSEIAEIQDRFISLRPAILKAHIERAQGLYNHYLQPELRDVDPGDADSMPVMHLDLVSSEETLAECQVPPSTALRCGARLLAQTAAVLDENSGNRDELSADERRRQNQVLNELPDILDRLPEGGEEVPETPVEEAQSLGRLSQSYEDRLTESEDEATSYIQ